MTALLRCKACGYVVAESAVKDVCPACGVPRKMLEPWTDTVSVNRRRILDLDLHPIVIHFAVSFTASTFALGLLTLIVPGLMGGLLPAVMLVMTAVLPFTVIAGWAMGLVDGKVRFRRITTPLLVRKMVLGGGVFVLTLAASVLVIVFGLGPLWTRIMVTALLAVALGGVALLSKIGVGLQEAKFPG